MSREDQLYERMSRGFIMIMKAFFEMLKIIFPSADR